PQKDRLGWQSKSQSDRNRGCSRAIILIELMIFNKHPGFTATHVSLMSETALPGRLGRLIKDAYNHEEEELCKELRDLRTNPAGWLALKKIFIGGGSKISGREEYVFFFHPFKNHYRFEPTSMYPEGPKGLWPGQGDDYPYDQLLPYTRIRVHYIPVQLYTDISGHIEQIKGTLNLGNDNLLLTTQLSGCSVMYQVQGTAILAAHIQPSGPPEGQGDNLAPTLRVDAEFDPCLSNAATHVFGKAPSKNMHDDYVFTNPNLRTYFIGVLVNGAWQLHAQQYNFRNAASPPDTWQLAGMRNDHLLLLPTPTEGWM
ncbi:MAG: hypothetical protein O7D91_19640, partial [Planctomycetota bacterium]|nr:hypothetical protein [Planctomycetota bacterium]